MRDPGGKPSVQAARTPNATPRSASRPTVRNLNRNDRPGRFTTNSLRISDENRRKVPRNHRKAPEKEKRFISTTDCMLVNNRYLYLCINVRRLSDIGGSRTTRFKPTAVRSANERFNTPPAIVRITITPKELMQSRRRSRFGSTRVGVTC